MSRPRNTVLAEASAKVPNSTDELHTLLRLILEVELDQRDILEDLRSRMGFLQPPA